MRFVAIVVLVVGCGSSSKSSSTIPDEPKETPAEKAAREQREQRDKEIAALKPADPYELRDKQAFAPSDRCGQGPYRLESPALAAKYGERLVVYTCGKHAVSGNYRLETLQKQITRSPSESAFGFTRDNAACKGREVAVVDGGASTAGGGGGGKGTGKAGTPAAAPATIKPITLTKSGSVATDCVVRSDVLSYGWSSDSNAPLDGARFTIDVWSDEPNDLEDLVFIIERHGVVSDMTRERWTAYNAAYDVWYKAYRGRYDEDVASGRTEVHDWKVKSPPPPPARAETPPPRPSKNARWIAGYWLYEEAKFHWITGLWDVPEEDVKRELTVQAPTPPPAQPARDDAPTEPSPTRTAVWTPGSWYWDGRAYVWVAGAWRIPPPSSNGAQHTWQRPTWTVRTGRAIYVPGGWRIRIGR